MLGFLTLMHSRCMRRRHQPQVNLRMKDFMVNTTSVPHFSALSLAASLKTADLASSSLDISFPVDEAKSKLVAMSSDCCGSNNYPQKEL